MKKGSLARALQARKGIDDEPAQARQERQADVDASDKPAAKTKAPARFHTSIYPTSKEFYDEIKIALIREGKDRDFNQLVNDLLAEWLDKYGD